MIRLRAGKRQGAGSTPGAYSETMSPRSASSAASSRCAAGYTRSTPQPSTATVVPRGSSAPRCASPSTPRAKPLTTTRPADASSRPSERATERRTTSRRALRRRPRPGASSSSTSAAPRTKSRPADRGSTRSSAGKRRARSERATESRAVEARHCIAFAEPARERRQAADRERGARRCEPVSAANAATRELAHASQLPRSPVRQGLGDVLRQHGFRARRAAAVTRDACHAGAPTTRKRKPLDGTVEQRVRRLRPAAEAREAALAPRGRARHGDEASGGRAASSSARARGHGDDEVEAVEQRPRELVAEGRQPLRRARASPPDLLGRRTDRGSSSPRAGSAPGRAPCRWRGRC